MTYKAPYKTSHAGKVEENLYYIINRGNDQGFVVIAADNRVSPIIAFAEKGSLTENDIQPKSVIRDFGERSVMNYYQLLKKIYYFTHYNCYISCVF